MTEADVFILLIFISIVGGANALIEFIERKTK